jgi:CDP-diacylglycerol--glycerol-3-phosphate 3-phosphatidyltransferase
MPLAQHRIDLRAETANSRGTRFATLLPQRAAGQNNTVAGMVSTQNTTEAEGRPPRELSSKVDPLHPDALNLPNLITLSRLLLAFVLFVLIYMHGYWITAAVVFVLAAATDALDGYIARRYGKITALGRILDPFADKIIICGAFIFLLDKKVETETGELWSGVNAWMVIIVVAREMFVTSLRGFLEQEGKDFSASLSGKLKMVLQCVAVTASLLSLEDRFSGEAFKLLRDVLLWSAVVVTIWSGLVYVVRAIALLRGGARS